MPTVKGSGRLQRAILAQLDGQAKIVRELIEEMLGHPPSHSEYNACHRAAHTLIDSGQLLAWLEPVPHRPPQLVIRRVDRWVRDGGTGTFGEQAQAADKLQAFCGKLVLAAPRPSPAGAR